MASLPSTSLGADEIHEVSLAYGTIIGTGVLSLVVCGARIITRAFVVKSFGIDDWACLVALSFTTAFTGIGVAVVANGSGRHVNHVSIPELTLWFKLYYACTCLSLIIALVVKTSLLLYLQRLFPTHFIERLITGMLIFVAVITIPFVFVDAFQCNPPKYVYDIQFVMAPNRAKFCLAPNAVYGVFLFQAILFFIVDIMILLLPIPVVWSLKIQRGKNILVLLIFVPAIIACIAPAFRFSSLTFLKVQDADITFHSSSALYWQAIEYNLGMVAGSLGCLRPLFRKIGIMGKEYFSNDEFSPSSYRLNNVQEGKHGNGRSAGRDGDVKPPKKGSAFRVQGDSVLNTFATGEREYGSSVNSLSA
ncbi:hypothetical protein F4861DRAFT_536302 [Xylaria intraflava]|nr:hypothetical protein F4861DRAFT_536302 [Xylaria intraflava]